MKTILFFLTFSFVCGAQNLGKNCDTQYLAKVESSIDNLTETELTTFLSAFDKECFGNVEFSEYYNELLFKITEKHTQELLTSLSKIDLEKKKLILLAFENEVWEVDNKKLIEKIKASHGNENLKKDLINAISKNK